jgi:hypothetical protein
MSVGIYAVGTLTGKLSNDQTLRGSMGYVSKETFIDISLTFKGNVAWLSDLANITAADGDVYYVEEFQRNWAYSNGLWWDIGSGSMVEDLTAAQIEELQGMVV